MQYQGKEEAYQFFLKGKEDNIIGDIALKHTLHANKHAYSITIPESYSSYFNGYTCGVVLQDRLDKLIQGLQAAKEKISQIEQDELIK